MKASTSRIVRWAVSNDTLTLDVPGVDATVSCGNASVDVSVVDGTASLTCVDALRLMPEIGAFTLTWTSGTSVQETLIERVLTRYCSRADLEAYGKKSNDGFDDIDRYPDDAVDFAIQASEECIEKSCGRSFTKRRMRTMLYPGSKICELPVEDVTGLICDDSSIYLISDRQCTSPALPVEVDIEYGGACSAAISEATMKLAASYLRPRAGAENARGASIDGVFVSYELADGQNGSWTGIPYVDATIEQNRSHRAVIA